MSQRVHSFFKTGIDHTIVNFGTAAYQGKTLYLSSSYFFMYSGTEVLRSVITHEFGHIFYSRLTSYEKSLINTVGTTIESSALFYLFHDGEYSYNARFGGHPEDSPAELFASAYNLFTNEHEELEARFKYIDELHKQEFDKLWILINQKTSRNR